MVFPLVIHSGTSVSCRHLFISIASLSRMEVNIWNQNPCMPSGPGVFQFGTLLSVVLSESMSIFAFGPSSSPSNSFPMLLIFSAFVFCSLGCYILLQNCFVSLAFCC